MLARQTCFIQCLLGFVGRFALQIGDGNLFGSLRYIDLYGRALYGLLARLRVGAYYAASRNGAAVHFRFGANLEACLFKRGACLGNRLVRYIRHSSLIAAAIHGEHSTRNADDAQQCHDNTDNGVALLLFGCRLFVFGGIYAWVYLGKTTGSLAAGNRAHNSGAVLHRCNAAHNLGFKAADIIAKRNGTTCQEVVQHMTHL